MDTLATIGLIVIVVAWIVQFITILSKSKNLSLSFVWLYFIGVVLLAIANIGLKENTSAILNLIIAVFALITVIAYPKKEEEKK
jgi:FtsH-binding integral membrane protein